MLKYEKRFAKRFGLIGEDSVGSFSKRKNMKISSMKPLILVAGIFAANAAFAQLLNPSFEAGTGVDADNWIRFGNAYREATGAQSGDYAMKMFGNFSGSFNVTGAFQDFAIVEGQSASAGVFAQTLGNDQLQGGNRALLKLIYRDAGNNDLAFSESAFIDASSAPDTFLNLTASLGAAPVGTDHGSVFLLFLQEADNAGGSVFFDNVSVGVVPEPFTMVGIAALAAVAARRKRK
jgi:hypothetical protein